MPSLYTISLEYNHLEQIPDIPFLLYDRFKKTLSVQLEGNYSNCAANMSRIWDGVDHEEYFSYDIDNITLHLVDVFRMRCHSPYRSRGLSFGY